MSRALEGFLLSFLAVAGWQRDQRRGRIFVEDEHGGCWIEVANAAKDLGWWHWHSRSHQ